jgi:hypothetical protein
MAHFARYRGRSGGHRGGSQKWAPSNVGQTRSQSTWRGDGDRRRRAGRPSFAIVPTASHRWIWFLIPTILFRLLYGFLILRHSELLWLGVTTHPSAEWIARQLTAAYGWQQTYQKYCNEARTHLSLQKDAPIPRAVQTVGQTLAVPILGGLHPPIYPSVSFRQGQAVVRFRRRERLQGSARVPVGRVFKCCRSAIRRGASRWRLEHRGRVAGAHQPRTPTSASCGKCSQQALLRAGVAERLIAVVCAFRAASRCSPAALSRPSPRRR